MTSLNSRRALSFNKVPTIHWVTLCALGFSTLLTGCNGNAEKKEVYSVSGTLLINGKPAADAWITLAPDTEDVPAPMARVDKEGLFQLLKAEDGTKDQSYFLYRLNQAQLSRTIFPLGDLYKRDVRELARKAELPTSEKKDSTGICFIGERPFREFLNRYLPKQPGEMQTPEGKIVGQHITLWGNVRG